MVSPYTQVFFHFAFLFSTYFTFVSEESIIAIDLAKKEIRIEYIDLKTPKEVVDQAETGLKLLNEASEFDESYAFLKLTSKEIYKKENKLNAIILFSYENQNEALQFLSFFRNPDGDLVHPILEKEKLISHNGRLTRENGQDFILWREETQLIKLKIKHGKLKENHLSDMVGLQEHWKE